MAASCPVAFFKVDEHLVRVHALLVTLVAAGFVWSGSVWLLALLVYDFGARVLFSPKLSPLFHLSRSLVAMLPLEAKPVDAGPKKFAAKIGLGFVMIGSALVLSGALGISLWLMSLMALFAALEASCGFCVGCKIYSLASAFFYRS